jgi:hypothetical protein
MNEANIAHSSCSYFFFSCFNGRVKANVAPLPSALFLAHILPPCDSTMYLEIYNPNPVPLSDFVANLENIFGKISRSIPIPVSLILMIDVLLLLLSELRI